MLNRQLVGGRASVLLGHSQYSPLGNPGRPSFMHKADDVNLLHHETVVGIALEIGATPAQVLLAWGLVTGTSVIPKTTKVHRLQENLGSVVSSRRLPAVGGIEDDLLCFEYCIGFADRSLATVVRASTLLVSLRVVVVAKPGHCPAPPQIGCGTFDSTGSSRALDRRAFFSRPRPDCGRLLG